jgi:hypothetical protein
VGQIPCATLPPFRTGPDHTPVWSGPFHLMRLLRFMFTELDRSDGSIRFSDERYPERTGQMILAALAVVPLAESMTGRLDGLILKVSNLHHRISPIGGPSPLSA